MHDKMNKISDHLNKYYGVKDPKINHIDYGVINSNFQILSDHGAYIFKIFNLSDEKNVSFELNILELLSFNNFPSPRIIQDKEGRLFRQFYERPAVLLRYIPGQMIKDITRQQMLKIGKGVGALHRILKNYEQNIKRTSWEPDDIKRYIQKESKNIIRKNFPDASNFISYVSKELNSIQFHPRLPVGITHQDIKPENIIIDPKGHISFIDFNNCYKGVLLYDVMTMVIWSCFKGESFDFELFKVYLSGYIKERPLTPVEEEYCFSAMQFRLLREAFVWPMRFNPEMAEKKSKMFLRRFSHLQTRERKYRSMVYSFLANSRNKTPMNRVKEVIFL